jgi:hypothetical protein
MTNTGRALIFAALLIGGFYLDFRGFGVGSAYR